MPNKLLEIDKKYGTQYATIMQGSPFAEFVDYIEQQADWKFELFKKIKGQYRDYKDDKEAHPMNLDLLEQFISTENKYSFSDILEYTVNFLSSTYNKADKNIIKQKLIVLAVNFREEAEFRGEHFDEFVEMLKVKQEKMKDLGI